MLIIQNCSNKNYTGDGNASDQSMIGEPRLDRARVSNACADQSIKARRNIQMERPSIHLSLENSVQCPLPTLIDKEAPSLSRLVKVRPKPIPGLC